MPLHITSLQKHSLREMPHTQARLAASLIQSPAFTTNKFAQKNEAKPVGGRGKSAFLARFLFGAQFSPGATSRVHSSVYGVYGVYLLLDPSRDRVYDTQRQGEGREQCEVGK